MLPNARPNGLRQRPGQSLTRTRHGNPQESARRPRGLILGVVGKGKIPAARCTAGQQALGRQREPDRRAYKFRRSARKTKKTHLHSRSRDEPLPVKLRGSARTRHTATSSFSLALETAPSPPFDVRQTPPSQPCPLLIFSRLILFFLVRESGTRFWFYITQQRFNFEESA